MIVVMSFFSFAKTILYICDKLKSTVKAGDKYTYNRRHIMPFKITITTTKPADSTVPWPFELESEKLNVNETTGHEVWASTQPGFIDRMFSWIEPGFIYEKIYIFDTRENAEAFLTSRVSEPAQLAKVEYFKEHGFAGTTEITEI